MFDVLGLSYGVSGRRRLRACSPVIKRMGYSWVPVHGLLDPVGHQGFRMILISSTG